MKKITFLLISGLLSLSAFSQQGPFLYQVEANWLAECDAATPLTTEDFEGASVTGGASCGDILSSESSNCFPVGELEDGFTITASNGESTFYGPPGQVGSNQDVPVAGVVGGQGAFTVLTFTEPVTRVAFDIFGISSSPGDGVIRVFDTSDNLLATFDIDVTILDFKFFGIHSSDLIGRLELEDPDDGEGLIFANLRFGTCRVNDDPGTATVLTVGDVFEDIVVENTNNFASDSQLIDPAIPAPGCASYAGADLWYSAVVPASGSLTVETRVTEGSSFLDSGLAVYTEDLTEVLECSDDDGEELFSLISLTDLTPGEIIFIRVWEFGGNAFGDFMVSAYDFSPPPNDLIENAIDVDELGFPYTDSDINMEDANGEALTNTNGCDASPSLLSVWYKFTAFADGTVTGIVDSDDPNATPVFYNAEDENATVDTLTFVESGTNSCTFESEKNIEAIAGQTYYVLVISSTIASFTIDSDTVLSTDEAIIDGFTFYPNPVENIINLDATQTIDHLTLFSITGQKVIDQEINATNSQLQIGGLKTGIYLMTVTSGTSTATYKVIKQ